MADFTLSIPEIIYERAQKIAQQTSRPVKAVLLEQLELWTETAPLLKENEEAELQALHYLSDDALWTIAREELSIEKQTQMQNLMDKNTMGTLTIDEQTMLTDWVERGQRLMLRKSEAIAILSKRGYSVSKQDLSKND